MEKERYNDLISECYGNLSVLKESVAPFSLDLNEKRELERSKEVVGVSMVYEQHLSSATLIGMKRYYEDDVFLAHYDRVFC